MGRFKVIRDIDFLRKDDIVTLPPTQPKKSTFRVLIRIPEKYSGLGHHGGNFYPTEDYWWVDRDLLTPFNPVFIPLREVK